jgi:Tfp pilus assembly PilM family ATPase
MGWRQGVRTGLDLAPDAITLVRVRERGRRRVVVEHRSEPLPDGLVVVSPVERNIVDEAAFDRALRAVAGRRGGPVSVALPDPVARVGLFDVAVVPTRPEEFDRLVRWHLEKAFAVEFGTARLTSQRFRRPDGEAGARILGSAVAQPVISQYEGALVRAGFEPSVVDLGMFHRFNLFRERIAGAARPDQHFIVLIITVAALSLLVFDGGRPAYIRIKGTRRPLTGADAVPRIVDEVELSLNAYGKEKDLSRVTHLFVSVSSLEPIDPLSDALAARFHLAVEGLGPANAGIEGLAATPDFPFARAAGALGAAASR